MNEIEFLLPYRGSFQLFKDAVESLFNQSDRRWTLKVIDNSDYKDLCANFLEGFQDSRIQYFKNAEILSISNNFQKALQLSHSKWVVIYGADDLLHPNYVSEMLKIIVSDPSIGFIHPQTIPISVSSEIIQNNLPDLIKRILNPSKGKQNEVIDHKQAIRRLAWGNYLYFPGIVWAREEIENFIFRSDLGIALDLDLELDILFRGFDYLEARGPILYYRRHASSESFNVERKRARIEEEKSYYKEFSQRCFQSGYIGSACIAFIAPMSRIHSLLHRMRLLKSR